MKKYYTLFLAILCISCSFHSRPVMTLDNFQNVAVGISEEDLIKTYGQPLNIYHKTNGLTVYEYSERFTLGSLEQRVVEERRYYFYIREGIVTSKRMVIRNPPPYEPMNDLNPDEI